MSWNTRPRKFVAGRPLRDIFDVLVTIDAGHWLMWRHKPMHPSIVRNWSILQIESAARVGWLHVADPNPNHPDNQPAEPEMEMPI